MAEGPAMDPDNSPVFAMPEVVPVWLKKIIDKIAMLTPN